MFGPMRKGGEAICYKTRSNRELNLLYDAYNEQSRESEIKVDRTIRIQTEGTKDLIDSRKTETE